MNVFQKSGRWGIAWTCNAGHRSSYLVARTQPVTSTASSLKCCRCEQSISVPMLMETR